MANLQPQDLGRLLHIALSSFHGSDTPPDARRSAGLWLESFQASPEAWGVVAGLLQDPAAPPDLQLFAAFTLKNKIMKDVEKLGSQQWDHLRTVLLQSVQAHSDGPKELLTQVFLGVVGLGRVWREWEDPLHDVQMRTSRINFLSFLQLLAEECCGEMGRGRQERSFDRGQIRQWFEPIVKYIRDLLDNPGGPAEVVQALNCFSAWVQLGALYEVELQTYETIAHKCFAELDSSNEEECEAAERSIRAMAECAPAILLEKLVTEVTALLTRVKQEALIGNTSGRTHMRYMQLFGECMMGNLEGLLSTSQTGKALRQSLLQSIVLPFENPMAIVPVLEVCEALAKYVVEVSHSNEQSNLISNTERQSLLGGIMAETVPLAGKLCRNKKGNDHVAATMQELQLYLCDAIGANSYTDWVMQYMSTPLADGYSWGHVECGLYCSEAIAPVLQQLPNGGVLSLAFLRGLTHIQLQHDGISLVLIIQAMSVSISALVDVVVCQDASFQGFEDLFLELAKLLIQGLDIQGGSQAASEALQKLLHIAIQKNIAIPLCIVSSVMQKAKELGSNGQKMDALLGTTIAAVRNVDDPYPMALRYRDAASAAESPSARHPSACYMLPFACMWVREQAATQVLGPIQEMLGSALSHADVTGSLEALEDRLVRALELLNRLLEDTAIWSEDFDGEACTMDVVNPLLRMFTTSLWPLLVRLCLNGLGSSCVQLLADTASLALSQMMRIDDIFLRGLLEMCQTKISDGGHCFVGPLCAAISSNFATAEHSEELLSAVEFICSMDRCQYICNLHTADEMPDVVISIFTLSGYVIKFHARFPTDRSMAIAERALKCASLFSTCHHKDVANSAVAYIKLALYSIIEAPQKCEQLVRCIEINGGEFMQNLIGAILVPVPYPRIHNIAVLFVLLATVLARRCSEGLCPFVDWLQCAFAAHQATGLPSNLASSAVVKWTPIITDLWECSLSTKGSCPQDYLTKKAQVLKKIIREFADDYMSSLRKPQNP